MFSETFTVIADHNNQRILILTAGFEISKEVCQRGIGIGDISIVEMIFVDLRLGSGRFVGIMRVI